jgi:predicted nuclease of predicted toxin-antitoxin system
MEVYFDENMPETIARAFNILLQGRGEIEIFLTIEIEGLGRGATDLQVAEYVASRKGIIVTRDTDFKKRGAITELCKQHGVGIFLLKLAKNQSNFMHIVELMAKRWQQMQDIMRKQDGHYCYTVSRDGLFEA